MRKGFPILFLLFLAFFVPGNAYALSNGQAADLVIGSADFTSLNGAFTAGCLTPTAKNLCSPGGMIIVGNKLIVTDGENGRVLIYNSVPTANNTAADVVLGKPNFTTPETGATPTMSLFTKPTDVTSDGTKLFIADPGSCRVLVYNTIPTVSGAPADDVFGNPDWATCNPSEPDFVNLHPATQTNMAAPTNIFYDSTSGKLFVRDMVYGRVLIFNSIPTMGTPANVVIGQDDFVTVDDSGLISGRRFGPNGQMRVAEGKFLLVDDTWGRVLVWNTIPSANNASANVVIGKTSLTDSSSPSPTASLMKDTPESIHWDGQYLYIGDSSNDRILVYEGIPTTDGAAASFVLGHTNFTTGAFGSNTPATDSTFGGPYGIIHSGHKLYVSDGVYRRILRFAISDEDFSESSIAAPEENCPETFVYCSLVGPNSFSTQLQVVEGPPENRETKVLIPSDASVNDIFVTINQQQPADLMESTVPFPWQQGLNTAAEVYNFQSFSAFNGYPLDFDKPVIIILKYDPAKLYGVSPRRLRISRFDATRNRWVVMSANTVLNTTNNTLANTTKKFGYFTVVYPAR